MLLLAVALFAGLIFFVYISSKGRRRSALDQDEFRRRWQRIEQLQAQGEAGWQLAVMEADKLLDQALRQSGYHGEKMGERLKNASKAFGNTDDVWRAHKLRNRLAHEQDVRLDSGTVSQALRQFSAALKDLGAL